MRTIASCFACLCFFGAVLSGQSLPLPPVGLASTSADPAGTPGDREGVFPLELSIEEAVLRALEQNHDLRAQRFSLEVADAFALVERGDFDPELFAEAYFDSERSSETDRGTAQQFSVEGEDVAGRLGLRKQFATGTEVEISVDQRRSTSSRTPEDQTARVGVTITQALLRGFGPAVNLARVRQADLNREASAYELRGFTEALVASVERAYWNCVLAREEIAIFEASLDLAKRSRDLIEERIEVGTLASNERAAVRAEVARRESALIDARSFLAESRLRLLLQIGVSGRGLTPAVEAVSRPEIPPEALGELDTRMALAERQRADLNEARLRREQDRLETIMTRNGRLPRLDAFVNYGTTGYADTLRDSFREVRDNTYDLRVGLEFSLELGNRTARGLDRAARATVRQAEEALANLVQLVRLDVHLAANEVERARQQIEATRVIREWQEQTVEAERERFEAGVSTALEVAQAQRDLLASRITEVESLIGYRLALVDLYRAEGSLLERRGISVLP